MTKKEYIDFIRNSLPMEDETDKFHRAQVAAALNSAINTAFYEMYEKNPKNVLRSLERYTPELTELTVTAPVSKYYISTLTFDVVDLPTVCGGIIEILSRATGVYPNISTTTTFVPVSAIQGRQLYGSEASLPGNVIGYSWTRGRVIEYWGMDAATGAMGAVARIIKQFRSYSDTDNVVLPYGQDERIIELVRQFLGAIPPKDLINDNADTNG